VRRSSTVFDRRGMERTFFSRLEGLEFSGEWIAPQKGSLL